MSIDNTDRGARGYNFIYPWKFQDEKQRSLETPHDFFLITILFFFNKPLEILHAYFFDTPTNFRNKPLLLYRIFYCDIYKLMYLQILLLNTLFMSIYQFLDSKTLSHMVLSVVGGSGWKRGS